MFFAPPTATCDAAPCWLLPILLMLAFDVTFFLSSDYFRHMAPLSFCAHAAHYFHYFRHFSPLFRLRHFDVCHAAFFDAAAYYLILMFFAAIFSLLLACLFYAFDISFAAATPYHAIFFSDIFIRDAVIFPRLLIRCCYRYAFSRDIVVAILLF